MTDYTVKNINPGAVFLNTDGHRLYYTRPDASLAVRKYHTPHCIVMCDNNLNDGKYRDTTESVIARIEAKIREVKEEFGDDSDGESNWHDRYESPYNYILTDDNGRLKHTNPRIYRSFHNPNVRHRIIEVHTTKSFKVPDVSTALFTDMKLPTAEFDVLYRDRVLVDMQGDERLWHLDTNGTVCKLRVLAYDIEVTQKPDDSESLTVAGDDDTDKDDDDDKQSGPSVDGTFPVDMIGYASFEIEYKAERDPLTGKCKFEVTKIPDWKEPKITQMVSHNVEEEVKNHLKFIEVVLGHHIICGHNIMGYDNIQWVNRLQVLIDGNHITGTDRVLVEDFIKKWTKKGNTFSYGEMKETVDIYPLSFDTLYASRALYKYVDNHSLKSLAKSFGYIIKDRKYLDLMHISMDTPELEAGTLLYNEHDVREQLGLTILLLPDAMRLCHMTGQPFNDCLPAGTTRIWDSMTHVQAHINKRIMPATIRAMDACEEIFHRFGVGNTKQSLFENGIKSLSSTNPIGPKTLKLLKYGNEMPDYCQYPQLIYNPYTKERLHATATKNCQCYECQKIPFEIRICNCDFCKKVRAYFPKGLAINDRDEQIGFIVEELKNHGHKEPDEELIKYADSARGFRNKKEGYHFPGGMTLHPDWPNVNAQFKMWWGVMVNDVGCLHPESMLMTTRGYKKAEDVFVGDEVMTHIGYQKIIDKRIKPTYNIVHIQTSSGNHLRLSPWHKIPIYINRGNSKYEMVLKKACDIKDGDTVLECDDYPLHADKKTPDKLKLLMAELIGIFDAEGSLRDECRDRVRHDRNHTIQKSIRYTNLSFAVCCKEIEFKNRIEYLIRECFKHIVVSDIEYDEIKDAFEKHLVDDYSSMSIPELKVKYRTSANFIHKTLDKYDVLSRKSGKKIENKCKDVSYSLYPIKLYNIIKYSDLKLNKQVKYENGVSTNGMSLQIGISSVVDEFKKWHSSKDFIFEHSEYCKAYSKGFIEGDGCVNERGIFVVQSDKNIDNLLFLKKCLIRFGVHCSISDKNKVIQSKSSACKTVRDTYCFRLVIGKNYANKVDLISKKYAGILKNHKRPENNIYKKVRRVWTCDDSLDVIDFTVENEKQPYFFSDFVLSRNSMYPCNLSAEDIGGDTTRFADPRNYSLVLDGIVPKKNSPYRLADEKYYWVWLKRLRYDVAKDYMIVMHASELHGGKHKKLSEEYSFVDDGYLIAIVVDQARGGAPFAMEAILEITGDLKQRKEKLMDPNSGATDRAKKQIAGAYQSMKATRNSGSVDSSREISFIRPGYLHREDINIAEFYDMFDVEPIHETVNGVPFEIKNIESLGWNGITVSDDGDVEIKPVINVIRHAYDGPMIKVASVGSHASTIVTPNHSIYTFDDDGRLEYVLPGDCKDAVIVEHHLISFPASFKDAFKTYHSLALPVVKDEMEPTSNYVYDLEMKDNHNFVDSTGMLVSNTHGIITAPKVSCRQFCLSGGSRITTLGQAVLVDAMDKLDKIEARTCYGDTDGIYASTSMDARTVPAIAEIFKLKGKGDFITQPDLIRQTVERINKKWQDKLNYPGYELEVEWHDGMLFVKHKNYLIFDHVVDKLTGKKTLKMKTKGNNFKSKDKPKFTVDILERVMLEVAREHAIWDNEDDEYIKIRSDIKTKSRKVISEIDFTTMPVDMFSVRQGIAPLKSYKQREKECTHCEGKGCEYCAMTGNKLSSFAARTNGIQHLLGKRLTLKVAMQCVVCVNPLPFIDKPNKSPSKPRAYLWPVDLLDDEAMKEKSGGIDYEWYNYSAFNYIKGAFGFDTWNMKPWVCTAKQMTLDEKFMVKIVPGDRYADKNVFASGSKMIPCTEDIFKQLTVKEPVPDGFMELLMKDKGD